MKTPYDFVTLALFAAVIVLFLQRSTTGADDPHPLWQYLVAAVGCAVTNYLGNAGMTAAGIAMLVVTIGYVVLVLHPFRRPMH